MQSLFEFPDELTNELATLNKGYLEDLTEVSMDKYVKTHASKEFIECWNKNMKKLKEEREKDYIIN